MDSPLRFLFLALSSVLVFAEIPNLQGYTCGTPGRPVDGWYVPLKDEYSPGENVTYYCGTRNVMIGNDTRVCQSNGSWNSAIPFCDKPSKVESALQSTTLYEHSATKALDHDYSSCSSTIWESDSYWTAFLEKEFTVTAIRLILPTRHYLSGRTVTQRVCYAQKDDDVDLEVMVKKDGEKPISCGRFKGQTGVYVSKVFYCPKNTSGRHVHVKDNAKMKHFFQLCEVEIFLDRERPCFIPDIPNNGYGSKRLTRDHTMYNFFCKAGFKLQGSNETICKFDGSWFPSSPTCEAIICKLPTIHNGHPRFTDVDRVVFFGVTINFTCDPGYTLKGAPSSTCTSMNTWSDAKPMCLPINCGPTPSIKKGKLVAPNGTNFNQITFLQCNEGYEPEQADKMICSTDERWKIPGIGGIIRCKPITCDDPFIPHGTHSLLDESQTYGSRMQIICESEYIPVPEIVKCRSDKTWGDLSNVCRVGCKPPTVDVGGIWEPAITRADGITLAGKSLQLRCPEGFEVDGGTQIIKCLDSGEWTKPVPICKKTEEDIFTWAHLSATQIMIAAIAVGAGTAVFILLTVMVVFVFRRRRLNKSTKRETPTLSSDRHPPLTTFGSSPEEHYYNTALYEELPDSPVESCLVEFSSEEVPPTSPARPKLPLPRIPNDDNEPVYSQPFEDENVSKLIKRISSNSNKSSKLGEVYCEPVDSYKTNYQFSPKTLGEEKRPTRNNENKCKEKHTNMYEKVETKLKVDKDLCRIGCKKSNPEHFMTLDKMRVDPDSSSTVQTVDGIDNTEITVDMIYNDLYSSESDTDSTCPV
ncbi:complement receptor type 2-like isoform X3 [Tachypleus tridentatus]|uniref:complement receptor type 2-like isoform X3 n=1 Tax=Tachypleus tridentatus TaxID=6853 RepID=UPI003FD4E21D